MEEVVFSRSQRGPEHTVFTRFSPSRFLKDLVTIVFVLVLVGIPYLPLTRAYFLGYDDFKEVHRAAFEDTQEPSRIFTTGHFGEAKYRPLNRWINFISYRLGHGSPVAFRTRNVLFHLLNCALVYCLGMLLFDARLTAALGAVLFGLNPLTHQAVAGAVMTNSAAASMALIAVTLGLWSYRTGKRDYLWLMLAVAIAWTGVFIYEADITALGVLFLYFALDYVSLRRMSLTSAWGITLAVFSMLVVASMLATRAFILPATHQPIAPVSAIARNTAMYIVAVLLPVDPLLANQWFGTPLVSEVHLNGLSHGLIAVACVGIICLVTLAIALVKSSKRWRVDSANVVRCAFLLGASFFSILPLLIFNDHPSETYLYVPVAYAMLLLVSLLVALWRSRPFAAYVLVLLLLASYGCATWGRTQRVVESAIIAQRVLSGLPLDNWRQGEWHILLANAPGYTLPHRYGLYTYRGLDTIGTGDGTIAVQDALQLQTGNEKGVTAEVLAGKDISQACGRGTAPNEQCFLILPAGQIEPFPADRQN